MGYRKCPNHGWLETAEYTVDKSGQTICPECALPTLDFSMNMPRAYEQKIRVGSDWTPPKKLYGATGEKPASEHPRFD